jgi:NTE family protein
VPTNLEEVSEREKDIRYSGRTRAGTEALRLKHDVRHNINALHEMLPQEIKDTPQAKWLYNFGCVTTMDIVQLIYRPRDPLGAAKDYEFGRATMNARWAQGYADARTTLFASPWLAPMPKEVGVRVFDVMHEILVKERPAEPVS